MYNLYIGQLCYIFSFVKSNKCNQVILPSAFAYPNLNHKVFGGPGRPNWIFNIFSVHCEYVHIRKTLVLNVDWGKQKSWLIYLCNVSQGATSCNPIQPAARSDADLRQALQKQLQSARPTLKQQRQKLQDALDNNQVTKWGIGGGHEWYYLLYYLFYDLNDNIVFIWNHLVGARFSKEIFPYFHLSNQYYGL